MRLNQLVFITSAALVSMLAFMQAAHAVETSVDFPVGQKRGTFSCTFDAPGQVKIDTEKVKIRGFCAGDPGVVTPGHWQGNSDDVKDYYFSVVKSSTVAGKVTISSDESVSMTCDATTAGKAPYPNGSKYCNAEGAAS